MILPLIFAAHTFAIKGDQFLLDGDPFTIRSGEMHYARVPRPYWRDRFKKMRAMGLNTVCTYVFWNAHEPEKGKFDFTGNLDVAEFVKEAQQEGLWVIVRPGPYVCSEWEWGGFPYWLVREPGIKIRQNNAPFLARANAYLGEVGKRLGPLTIRHGGPILMCQVENEYGSFGKDHEYMAAIRDGIRSAGFDCQLFTADGPSSSMFGGGALPDCLAAANFGGDPAGAFRELQKFRPGGPRMVGEFWAGWFDHWGDAHARTSSENQAKDLDTILSAGGSFNIYMVHGGTTFGWMNGANWTGNGYEPDVTSYDYDAAIAEDGRITPKWQAFREVIRRHLPSSEKLPPVPSEAARTDIAPFTLTDRTSILSSLPPPVRAERPLRFEELGHPYGFVLYRATGVSAARGELVIEGLQDRAIVYAGRRQIGTLERRLKGRSLEVNLHEGESLEILVENQGRINFSRELLNEHKGFASATFNNHPLRNWEISPLPTELTKGKAASGGGPAGFFGSFTVTKPADTFLDMRGGTKGVVWVNGHNLGRYWRVGAQQSLYLPGCWLRSGRNDIAVLELEPKSDGLTIQGSRDPIYEVGH